MSKVYRVKFLKDKQNVQRIEKSHSPQNNVDELKKLIIKPIKLDTNNKDVNLKYNKIEQTGAYIPDKSKNVVIKHMWSERTNVPYKKIIQDDNYSAKFLQMKNPKTEKEIEQLENEFAVHKVTVNDKVGADSRFKELEGAVLLHNNELKNVYSTNKRVEHEKKFIYNHVYKHAKYDDKNNEVKDDPKISKLQDNKQEESDRRMKNNIIDHVNNGNKKMYYKNRQRR